jgi:phage repressor protein C with HTH and peptisase S24 domain
MSHPLASIGERARFARQARGISQEGIAEHGGPPRMYLQRLETSTDEQNRNRMGKLVFLAKALQVSLQWLLTGEGEMDAVESATVVPASNSASPRSESEDREWVSVPRFDVVASAGPGQEDVKEVVVEYVRFSEPWLRQALGVPPQNLSLLTVEGESMEPLLRAGDLVMVNSSTDALRADGVFLMRLEGSLLIKRIQRLPGGLYRVTSENPAYEAYIVDPNVVSDFNLLGRIVWAGRRL